MLGSALVVYRISMQRLTTECLTNAHSNSLQGGPDTQLSSEHLKQQLGVAQRQN